MQALKESKSSLQFSQGEQQKVQMQYFKGTKRSHRTGRNNSQGPHWQILMTGGGGGVLTEVHILYPKISQLQNLSTPKNHYFFSIPQKIP